MTRIVIAIANETLRESIAGMLQRNGIEIRNVCQSGREAIRAIKRMGGGVVILSARLTDMTADEFVDLLYDDEQYLLLARPTEMENCVSDRFFRVALPVHSGELLGCVRILMQLDERIVAASVPKRTEEEKQVITTAKELLMEKNSMTEDQAYRFIQKRSMETSTPMPDVAQMILTALS